MEKSTAYRPFVSKWVLDKMKKMRFKAELRVMVYIL